MSPFYEFVGRLVIAALRTRYRRQLRTAAAIGIAGVIAIGYVLATREAEEG